MGVWFCCDEDKDGGVTWGTEVRACSQLGWIIRQQIDVVCYAKAQLGATTGPSFPPPTPSSGTMVFSSK